MTRTYTTNKGVTHKRAGVYTTLTPEQGVVGISSGGTIFLVGESDGGPHWSVETKMEDAWFGPDQRAEVMRKYVNGPLVAAYVGASRPSGDDAVNGAPSKIYLVKTNASVRATSVLTNIAAGTYHTLADKNYGTLGNMIYRTVTSKSAEVVPTTGAFTLLIPNNTTAIDLRVNGGAALTPPITAALLPPAIVTNLNALTGVDATGGTDRATVSAVAGTLAVAIVSGNDVTFTRSIVWNTTPTVGDSIYIPSGSVIQGASNENRGSYVVTAVTTTTISATKLLDAAGAAGACTAPVAVAATNIAAVTDLKAYAPVVIFAAAADPIDGAGKTLEINELTSQTGRFTDLCYQLNTTKVTWISTAASPKVINSTSEYAVYLNVYRQYDNVSERIGAGGEVAFALSYAGTTATMTITSTTLTTTVVGGSGASQTLSLGTVKKPVFPTIADLVAKLNSLTGYSCAIVTTSLGQRSPFMLDEVTALGICSTHGGISRTGRVKVDAAKFFDAVQASPTVQLGATTTLNVPAACGLPALATSAAYLAGGARGATTDAAFQLALDALERIRGNIIVPLISRDATADIADGVTDAASTYTLAATNAYCKTHVLAMSDTKVRRERQALCSCEGTFAEQRQAAADAQPAEEVGQRAGHEQQAQPLPRRGRADRPFQGAPQERRAHRHLLAAGAQDVQQDHGDGEGRQAESGRVGQAPAEGHDHRATPCSRRPPRTTSAMGCSAGTSWYAAPRDRQRAAQSASHAWTAAV